MSDDSAYSAVGDDDWEEERGARGTIVETHGMARQLKALFCCFGLEPRVRSSRIVECEADSYDYVVEKLVVRRVPLALFAIPADLADNVDTLRAASAPGGAAREASTRLGGRMDCRAGSSVWRERIQNRFDALHPDLKESKRSLEHRPNLLRNRRLSAEDISEMTSSTRTDVSSRTMSSSVTVQDDVPTRDNSAHCGFSNPLFGFGNEIESRAERDEAARGAFSGKERDTFVPGWNRKYIVSPFRVRRGSFNLAKPNGAVGDRGAAGKSLSYVEESLEDESSEPTADVRDRDLKSNPTVRWRITLGVKRQRANATLEHAAPVRLEL